jgi:hypothetical protein
MRPFVAFSLAHPQAILTLKTALQIYGMSDSFPLAPFDLAFKAGSRKNSDPNLHQYFISSALFPLGRAIYKWEGYSLPIYDKERLLIEIFRFRKRLDPDTYKRAIFFYRDLANSNRFLSSRFEEYASVLPQSKRTLEEARNGGSMNSFDFLSSFESALVLPFLPNKLSRKFAKKSSLEKSPAKNP